MIKNPPAITGDAGCIPGLGRSHMPWSNSACAPQLLSLCSGAQEAQPLKPMHPRAPLQQELPLQWEALSPQPESGPCSLQLQKSPCSNRDLAWPPNSNTRKRHRGSSHRKGDAGGASCGPSVRGGRVLGVPSRRILGVLKDQWIYQEIRWWCETMPMMFLVWGVGRTELPSTERWGSVGGGG